jgi:peptide/nickel transport system permease protein
MQGYVAKRVLLFIPTVLLVTMLVFALMRLIPGDPAFVRLAGSEGITSFTQEQLAKEQARLGTDRPIHVQYGDWVWDMLRLDFGVSMYHDTPIWEDLKQGFPVTLELTFLALLLAITAAVPLGVISAMYQDRWIDYLARVLAIAGVALPTFWTALLLIYFLILLFGWFPPLGYENLWDAPGTNLQQLIFPAIALGFYDMALVARVTRSSMLEVLRDDYIRTARSKGLQERVVITRHALKNAFLPVLTISGWQFGRLLAGTVIIETIFLVPGMGRLLLDSIFHRDYTMTQAIVMVVAVVVLLLNLFIDLLYGWLDPRIRYQ